MHECYIVSYIIPNTCKNYTDLLKRALTISMHMPRDKIGSWPVRKAIIFGENPSGIVIYYPQVLENDPAMEVDDLVPLVVSVQPAVLIAMRSVQAVLLSLSLTFLWRLSKSKSSSILYDLNLSNDMSGISKESEGREKELK